MPVLSILAWISIAVAITCAIAIAIDEIRRPQHMAVMNIVWPVTALYFSVFGLWFYFSVGVKKSKAAMQQMSAVHEGGMHGGGMQMGNNDAPPTAVQTATATTHCGAGCMLADVVTEFAIAGSGLVLFGSMLWTDYVLDFVAAWALGIVFQYFSLRPMRPQLSAGQTILAAVKADTLSILAFQVGMYLFMALSHFKLLPHVTPFDPRYWLSMQVAMVCGFATSFPMNNLLVRKGLKEKM